MPKKSSKISELANIFFDNDITAETIELHDDFIFELKKEQMLSRITDMNLIHVMF